MGEVLKGKRSRAVRKAALEVKVLPPLTEKQAKCLEYIFDYFARNRYYPTHREVAAAMSVRSNTAEIYIEPLERKGYLLREEGKQRNLRLTPEALERLQLNGVDVRERLTAA